MGLFLGVCYEGTFIPKGTVCLQNMRVINSELGLLKGDALLTRSVVWTSVVRSRGRLDNREGNWPDDLYQEMVCPKRYVQ